MRRALGWANPVRTPLAICAYCGAHGHDDLRLLGWTRVPEPDGPPRGLPAEWDCCQACREAEVPHQMRVRRRFDHAVLDLFTWGARAFDLLEPELQKLDSSAVWLLNDLVRRGVLECIDFKRSGGRAIAIYRDPRPIWTRVLSRLRRWWRNRKRKD